MDSIKIAWKNLKKNKSRFITTISLLSFGVFLFIIYGSFVDGFIYQSLNGIIEEDIAHIRVRSKSYDEDFPLSLRNTWIDTTNKLSRVNNIDYTERLEILGDLDTYEDVISVKILGINTSTDSSVHKIDSSSDINLGEFAWLGAGIAKDMNLKEGDFINLTFQDRQGSYASVEYEIAGFISSSNAEISEKTVVVDLKILQKILGEKLISYYSIKVPNKNKMQNIVSRIKLLYPSNEVLTWKELTNDFSSLIKDKTIMLYYFYFIIAVISFLGLVNTILISVWEKRRLTGMLRALGYFDKEIISFFLWEGIIVSVISVLLGGGFAFLCNIPLVYIGLNYGFLISYGDGGSVDFGFYIPPMVCSTWNFLYFVIPMIFLPLSSLIVSYFPARKSIQMTIVECIKNKD